MADVQNLVLTEATEDELWAHGLSLADAFDLLDEGRFRTFRDPKHPRRRYMIGPDKANRLLTLIVEAIDSTDDCLLITGWQSNAAERTLFSRPGGTKHAR